MSDNVFNDEKNDNPVIDKKYGKLFLINFKQEKNLIKMKNILLECCSNIYIPVTNCNEEIS